MCRFGKGYDICDGGESTVVVATMVTLVDD